MLYTVIVLCLLLPFVLLAARGKYANQLAEEQGALRVIENAGCERELIEAIIWVESGGDEGAVGQDGELGCLQIRPIMVEEVNRILENSGKFYDPYDLEDRLDRHMSVQMFRAYSIYWATHYDDWSFEGITRRWNGGPRGHLKKSTKLYWDAVLRRLHMENIKGTETWTP